MKLFEVMIKKNKKNQKRNRFLSLVNCSATDEKEKERVFYLYFCSSSPSHSSDRRKQNDTIKRNGNFQMYWDTRIHAYIHTFVWGPEHVTDAYVFIGLAN